MTDSRSTRISTNDQISFLFMAEQYSTAYKNHIYFTIYPSLDI